MKINFPILDESLDLESVPFLVLKSSELFSKTVQDLYRYGDEESSIQIFNKQYVDLKKQQLIMVTDILGFDINTTPVLKMVYEEFETQLNDNPEEKTKLELTIEELTDLLRVEMLENDLDLTLTPISIKELLKAFHVKIETTSNTIFEKMLEIIQITQYLKNKKMLVFVNATAYLNQQELRSLVEYASLNSVQLLCIERNSVEGFPNYEIDEDYFVTKK